MLSREGIPEKLQSSQRSLDMRYKGQGFELNLKTAKPLTEKSLQDSIVQFHEKHREIYGYSAINEEVEIVNAKLRVIGFLEKPSLKKQLVKKGISNKYETRNVYFESIDTWIDTPIIDRNILQGNIKGPAIIEQYDATTVLYPDWYLVKDLYGNLKLRRSHNES